MNNRFNLVIELGNDAMQTLSDVAAALRRVAERLEEGDKYGSVRDANGNTVGSFLFKTNGRS